MCFFYFIFLNKYQYNIAERHIYKLYKEISRLASCLRDQQTMTNVHYGGIIICLTIFIINADIYHTIINK